jgi:hypothetical protein
MKKKQRKLSLKKVTVRQLTNNEKVANMGGRSQMACSVTICFGTLGCCQHL